MADVENSSLDPRDELHNSVSNLCFSAKKEEQKIENLIDRLNSNIATTKSRDQAERLRHEIRSVERHHQFLNKCWSKISMKLCQIVDQDCDYWSFQNVLQQELGDLDQGKKMMTDKKILLGKQAVELFTEEQAEIKRKRKELERRFLLAFRCERRNQSKKYIYDCSILGIESTGKVKFSKTSWSWQILKGFENELDSFRLRPWNLGKVMTQMYGFNLEKVQSEMELMRVFEENLFFVCQRHKALTGKNLIKETIDRKRSKLEALLFSIRAIRKRSDDNDSDDDLLKAKELLIEWLSLIEQEIFFIAVDLVLSASDRDRCGSERIQKPFRRKLLELKRRRGGRVLVVVYRLVRLLEGDWLKESAEKSSTTNKTNKNSLTELNSIRVSVSRVYDMILNLMSVLYANVGLCCSTLSEKEVLVASVEIVERCDYEWRAIRTIIDKELSKNV